ncbi:MAG: DNA topoisomerase I [Candidatus Amoebophilus sp. 36-38]|nr:MAG: DNA topoisomerase I [Candidatus Amoebophilus sp. 36-38]
MSKNKNLVIVESPAKAKTIQNYLGKEYEVASSYGHVRDLPKHNKAIDISQDFQDFLPTYEINKDKQKLIKELKTMAQRAEKIYLASDDDREGEAISWHLKEALHLDDTKTKRIVFREITKNAILNAIKNPRDIDLALVNSQQARRILDRLVGYDLSPLLWKKIKPGLSAGRVQSVAVRMIVERERAIHAFVPINYFVITALFNLGKNQSLAAELVDRFSSEKEAYHFLEKCIGATFSIKDLEKKLAKRTPSAPFTTSTLQQEASQKLGYGVTRTMLLAQNLYEAGKISYMRTDSVALSQEAIQNAQKEIQHKYGAEYFQERHYKTKSATAQEAHEAIRPTDFSKQVVSQDPSEQRLYELIWKRAIASQMTDAQLEKTTAHIAISTTSQELLAHGEVLKFDGFLKVYATKHGYEDEQEEDAQGGKLLPPLTIGQILDLNYMQARERFTKPPARYSEASLVKQLEEQGIGRPSTYAPTITTIQQRGYIIKESKEGKERNYQVLTLKDKEIQKEKLQEITGTEKNKLFPTDIAMVVNDFLVERFAEVTDYGFTAKVESQLDEIATGNKEWNQMLAEFYQQFYPKVEETGQIERTAINTSRLLGHDPVTGKPVTARIGRFGPLVQIGTNEEEEAPRFASLRQDQRIENITLEEALTLFKFPRIVGQFETLPVQASIGRFGPYLKHHDQYYTLPKEDDPLTITEERAIEVIQAKRKADAEKIIKTFKEDPNLQILNGRWGPYLKAGDKNIKLPKDIDISYLDFAACQKLVEQVPVASGSKKKVSTRK